MSAFITVLRVALVIICVRCRPCIRSYSDHFIDYILQNINTDSSIIDLGHKISTEQCQNSCINLNYLCDFSIDNVFDNAGKSNWGFDSQTCITTVSDAANTGLAMTSDLVSDEYIIDVQLTVDPSNHPSSDPSNGPSHHPSNHRSNNPSNDPTAQPSGIPTQFRHQSEGRVFESTNVYESTSNVAGTKNSARMNPMVVVVIILVVVLGFVFCVVLWFYLSKRSKANITLSNSTDIEDVAVDETVPPQTGAFKGQVVMTKEDVGECSTEVVGNDTGEGILHWTQKDEDNQNIVNVNGVTKGDINDGIGDDEFVVVGDDEMHDTA
eukprot:230341_1